MIRQIFPESGEVVADLTGLVFGDRRVGERRPWVMVNMVTSIDGATAVEGGATGLTNADDQAMFHAFRAVSDVVLVGAATVRAEGYGPVVLRDAGRQARLAAGRTGGPRLAVISGSLDLDPSGRLFSDPENRPILFTGTAADSDRLARMSAVAEVVVAPVSRLDLGGVLAWLSDRGHNVVLCEGGPTVNGRLLSAGLVDEINVSTVSFTVAGESARMAHGGAAVTRDFRLDRLLLGERTLFARWLRAER